MILKLLKGSVIIEEQARPSPRDPIFTTTHLCMLTFILSIGEGAYSSVYHVRRIADGDYYALKKVRMQKLSDKEKDNALNEVRILASIKHPNIIAYKEAFIDDASQSLW
jgi:serine/threonine protein kinase